MPGVATATLLTALQAPSPAVAGPPAVAGHPRQPAAGQQRGAGEQPRSAAELLVRVHAAKASCQACRHREAASILPGLLADAELASRWFDGDDQQRCAALLTESYHVAASLLLKTGSCELAWVMADRGAQAEAGSRWDRATASSRMSCTRPATPPRRSG